VSAQVHVDDDGGDLVRIDVPTMASLSPEALQRCLKQFWQDLGHLPEDTPVIKG
jgi:hypothetical protein